ncbi:glycosyl transferase [Rhizobium sp. Root1203]|uniref:glycosyltransferase family 4 protein n=1 Tax=Rhizobium sp. Root1203 TaxID=1736427 RepID=UPI0007097BA4|nr:glycosyltransferase family 4 protein [Rhizobium sp. Root1203]KQV30819.1 glycosyl transferase [Rhizobium sp. Root1203]
MRIAFYAPLKSPSHPVPSGDRLMARQLIRALELAGHTVDVASEFRSFAATPEAALEIQQMARGELERLRLRWADEPRPELWFCYHPYYKSPDLFGPDLCAEFGIPCVTAEASYSPKRDQSDWAPSQARIAAQVREAAVSIALTERDRLGLQQAVPEARIASLSPFIDTAPFLALLPKPEPSRLISVAMMRSGDKMQSYAMLAAALRVIKSQPWTLTIVGDGPMRTEVEELFGDFGSERIEWLGEQSATEILAHLAGAGIYVWPGCGEAYGLAYLEAQAAGLPVVAQRTAGVPEVVQADFSGYLTPDGDIAAYAASIGRLLADPSKRSSMGEYARRFVFQERSLTVAASALDTILRRYAGAAT